MTAYKMEIHNAVKDFQKYGEKINDEAHAHHENIQIFYNDHSYTY